MLATYLYSMDITHKHDSSGGSFFIEGTGKKLGELTYSNVSDALITIDHTEVSEELKGKGAGKQLVSAAVDFARKNKLTVKLQCSFAKSVFERVREFQDVLKP